MLAAFTGDLVVGTNSLAGVNALDREALVRLPATTRRGTTRRLGHVVPLPGPPGPLMGPCRPMPIFRVPWSGLQRAGVVVPGTVACRTQRHNLLLKVGQ